MPIEGEGLSKPSPRVGRWGEGEFAFRSGSYLCECRFPESGSIMPVRKKSKTDEVKSDIGPDVPASATSAPASGFDPGFILRMQEIAAAGLNPSSALELIIRLIAEVPAASKESMEQIKMLDKLLNTARAMMETRLKNEEAAELSSRLEKLEAGLFDFLRNSSEAPASVQSSEHDSTEHP